MTHSLITASMPAAVKNGRIGPAWRGRLVENAVGAALVAMAEQEGAEVFYWRDRQEEVDYVLRRGQNLVGIEGKSGKEIEALGRLQILRRRFPGIRLVVIGREKALDGVEQISLEDFFIAGNI